MTPDLEPLRRGIRNLQRRYEGKPKLYQRKLALLLTAQRRVEQAMKEGGR